MFIFAAKKKKMKHALLLLAVICLNFHACKKDDPQPAEPENVQIEKYVAANNLKTTVHPSGIHYFITTEGTGTNPAANATVNVKYKGYFLDGRVFDQNTTGVEFPLRNLIQGWQIAIPLLKKDGKGTFIIPSALAYGSTPRQGIPANSVLVFEIELLDFR
jgi:FKBP-type peptidyl-prolyl cis-trans isomerase FkpA